jgi:hypothetical protein
VQYGALVISLDFELLWGVRDKLVAALPLLERAAHDAVAGTLRPQKVDLPSRLWSHPTLWQYVKTGLRRGYARSESPQ